MQPGSSRDGLTKCKVYFENGAQKDFRSFDSSGRYEVRDPREYGIRGLKKMVAKFSGVKEAILYEMATDVEIERLQDGQWVAPVQA